ncbi:putative membrane protein [Halobacteroides halobius DSM 5150]|uniref:Putative membrane protein n=1 Tax=Halobacteroides halobius (strain ATCC 35273 / DSM 5150 / MD-1) TaxID=748449 RepID=L0KCA8_HALHC|nr:lysine exporter LysO family protein [Halobacteroides halobius]AGB41713.1 putative membrane protein [Halobacteroides halobius DSM 5150]
MFIAIIATLILGILLGHFIMPSNLINYLSSTSTYLLAVLLFGVGIDIGGNKEVLNKLKEFGFKLLLIPILIAIGSISGAVISGKLLGLPFNEASAIGAGFGWYSLSGVLLAKIYSAKLGALAFLTNVFRELIAIILIPIMAKLGAKVSIIAPGGATTMDTTLPLISKTTNQTEIIVISFVSGAILSSLVPILVPILIEI